jgi:hypothetical protein
MKEPKNLKTIVELGGTTKKIRRLINKNDLNWSAFNPSIAYSKKTGYICLIRSSNYFYNDLGHISLTTENTVKNRLYIARLNSDFSISSLSQVKYLDGPEQKRGNEDARLFQRNGEWFFHIVMREEHTPNPRVCVYHLDVDSATAVFIKKYESNEDYNSIEKNWMLPSKIENPNFEFIYDAQSVVKKDGNLVKVLGNEDCANLHGGSNLLEEEDGSYVALCHYTYHRIVQGYAPETFGVKRVSKRTYTHVFARYNQSGQMTHISKEFVFQSPRIEFGSGIENYNEQFVISYGVQDLSSNLAFIDKSKVYEMLKPVGENNA